MMIQKLKLAFFIRSPFRVRSHVPRFACLQSSITDYIIDKLVHVRASSDVDRRITSIFASTSINPIHHITESQPYM